MAFCQSWKLYTWIRYGSGDSKQLRQREWILYSQKRNLIKPEEITQFEGFMNLKSFFVNKMLQGTTREGLSLVIHLNYSDQTIISPSTDPKNSDVHLLLAFGRSCGGGKKLRTNYCCRVTMFVSKELAYNPSTKLGELQFLSRLIEDKCWVLFEEINDSAEKSKPDLSVTPLYISFARDEVAYHLVPIGKNFFL